MSKTSGPNILIWPIAAAWEFLRTLVRRVPGVQRFDDWANEKERQWRRRRNRSLVAALSDAGLHEGAEMLDAATRGPR